MHWKVCKLRQMCNIRFLSLQYFLVVNTLISLNIFGHVWVYFEYFRQTFIWSDHCSKRFFTVRVKFKNVHMKCMEKFTWNLYSNQGNILIRPVKTWRFHIELALQALHSFVWPCFSWTSLLIKKIVCINTNT